MRLTFLVFSRPSTLAAPAVAQHHPITTRRLSIPPGPVRSWSVGR